MDIIRFAIIKLTSFETALIHELLYQLYDVQGINEYSEDILYIL